MCKPEIKHAVKKGFTLVEMLVSLFVFSIAVVVAAGSFLSVLAVNKKAQATKTVVNNLSYAMEIMTREIRTGTEYKCGNVNVNGVPNFTPSISINSQNCNQADSIIFKNYSSTGEKNIAYVFSANGSSQPIYYTLYRWEDGVFIPMISHLALINKAYFKVNADSSVQPKITVIMAGKAGDKEKYQSEFNIQTTVSQRVK